MALDHDLTFDHVINPLGPILQVVRFDFTPAASPIIPTVLVEVTEDVPEITIPREAWETEVEREFTLVERALAFPRTTWSTRINDDLELKFNTAGTTLELQVSSGSGPFERQVTWVNPGGVPSITIAAYDASDPILIGSWRVWHDAVAELFQLNE